MSIFPDCPGAQTDASIFLDLESDVQCYARNFPAVFERAEGCRLFTRDGDAYIDFLMGCSSLNYGHNPPDLKQALLDYIANDGVAHSLDLYSTAKQRFLESFSEHILKPRGLDYVVQFPGPTGANAVEAALKLARKVTGRQNVIAFTNGFHGVTLGALACTGNAHHRGGAGLPLGGVDRMPYDGYMGDEVDTAQHLEQLLSDPSSGVEAPAAIIVETVQGEGGLNVASATWLQEVARIARKHGALFIVDDIQAGVGRTGSFFSFEDAGLRPDMVTLAKSISGYGLPMALVLIAREHDAWAPGEHNGTFRGNCHAFVTAAAAIERYWKGDGFERMLKQKSDTLARRLGTVVARYGEKRVSAKGRGMMMGLDVKSGKTAERIIKRAFENGLIIETGGPHGEVVKCLAPLTIEDSDLASGLDVLEDAVDDVMRHLVKSAA